MNNRTHLIWDAIKTQICVVAASLITVNASASITEARLHSDQISFTGPNGEIEIVLSELLGEQFQISVKFGDKVIKVPKRFLFKAKNINEESIRLRVPTPNSKDSLWKQAADTGFFICFDFGGTYDHGTEGKPVEVFKALMIEFEHGELKSAEMAIPSGEFKNQWTYHYRKSGALHEEGKEETGKYETGNKSAHCPWFRSDGQ